jgi:hypothetical protein
MSQEAKLDGALHRNRDFSSTCFQTLTVCDTTFALVTPPQRQKVGYAKRWYGHLSLALQSGSFPTLSRA